MSDTAFKEYCQAFANFQSQVTNAEEDGTADRNNKYATITSILNTIKKPLADNGLSFSQSVVVVDGIHKVKTTIRHIGGYSEVMELDAQNMKITDARAVGSLVTYLRRYSLVSVFGIGSGDDDGQEASANNHFNNTGGNQTVNTEPDKNIQPKITEKMFSDGLDAMIDAENKEKLDKCYRYIKKYELSGKQEKALEDCYQRRSREV